MGTSTDLVDITESDDEVDAQLQQPNRAISQVEATDSNGIDGVPVPEGEAVAAPAPEEERITSCVGSLLRLLSE